MKNSIINTSVLSEKTSGSLIGVAIGDAMGLPVECKSPSIIRSEHGYVDSYISNKGHKYKEVSRRAAGTFSDDTQLTLALMDSLSKGYSIPDLRRAHVDAFQGKWGKPLGWGKSTRTAVDNIMKGINPSCVEDGAGNGPCMKIAPLAIFYVYKCAQSAHKKFTNSYNAALFKRCSEITSITHGDMRCAVAAYCQSRMIVRALQDEIPEFTRQIAALIIEDATYAESRVQWTEEELLSTRLKEILTNENFDRCTPLISRDICTCQSSFVMNSYPLVAYCVAKYLPYKNFQYAITETINAGADADSNGAMVGAIAGAWLGLSAIPIDLVKNLRNWKIVLKQIKQFEISL